MRLNREKTEEEEKKHQWEEWLDEQLYISLTQNPPQYQTIICSASLNFLTQMVKMRWKSSLKNWFQNQVQFGGPSCNPVQNFTYIYSFLNPLTRNMKTRVYRKLALVILGRDDEWVCEMLTDGLEWKTTPKSEKRTQRWLCVKNEKY